MVFEAPCSRKNSEMIGFVTAQVQIGNDLLNLGCYSGYCREYDGFLILDCYTDGEVLQL